MSFAKLPVLSNGLTIRHEDIFPDEAMTMRMGLLRNLMQELNVAVLLIYSDGAVGGPVCYLTNYPSYRIGRRGLAVLGLEEGPFLYTADPSRNVPSVRRFTSCDLEGSKKFLSLACKQAAGLTGSGAIGLVGGELLSMKLAEDMEKEFSGLEIRDISKPYYRLMASKDESSLKATKEALDLAEQGIDILKEQITSGKDLWQLAAYVDYRLRLLGCENTNILMNSAPNGRLRPAYPDHIQPASGDVLISYVAVRHARHWGAVGCTLSVGSSNIGLDKKLSKIRNVQNNIAVKVRPEMTLEQIEADIRAEGKRGSLVFAEDMPILSGTGFDLSEYPIGAKDRVGNNTVLQIVLTVDPEEKETTATVVDMLQVTEDGGTYLSRLKG